MNNGYKHYLMYAYTSSYSHLFIITAKSLQQAYEQAKLKSKSMFKNCEEDIMIRKM